MTEFRSNLEVFGGDIVYAADLNAVIASLGWSVYKDTLTARNTTTTLTADDGLAGITLPLGVYDIDLHLFYTVASTTPKLKTRWGFTGTIDNRTRLVHGTGSANVGAPDAVTDATFRGYTMSTQDAIYNSSTSAAYTGVIESVTGARVTVAGDLSLDWAQQTSNGSNVTVQPGTAFRIRRVSDV